MVVGAEARALGRRVREGSRGLGFRVYGESWVCACIGSLLGC